MPSGDRNRLLCNDFQCVRQFACGILCRRLGPHNPPALDGEPLSQPVAPSIEVAPLKKLAPLGSVAIILFLSQLSGVAESRLG